MFLYRFFIRTTDSMPIVERAATMGRRERGDWVFVGRVVGTIVGNIGVVWVTEVRGVGIIEGGRGVTGRVAVAAKL
jgi:hypothetical protein